jgi:hypothetical protein
LANVDGGVRGVSATCGFTNVIGLTYICIA